MSSLLSKLENMFAAVAFAECGEWDTARMIAGTPASTGSKRTDGRKNQPRPRARVAR